jgi:hypothetical protein
VRGELAMRAAAVGGRERLLDQPLDAGAQDPAAGRAERLGPRAEFEAPGARSRPRRQRGAPACPRRVRARESVRREAQPERTRRLKRSGGLLVGAFLPVALPEPWEGRSPPPRGLRM